ncbi:MAG: tRNA pseudouridine(55) synthase TruB [Cryobacterium sp.]|nr:tRNA pseudouridine(55) synthase TruB [Cryobacterium sp.]
MQAATSGILLVDKPGGLTSHDVVSRVRRAASTRKVGHAGTLDPMATGLLVLGVGSSTRLLTYLVGLDKEYLATIRLGVTTTTDDAEGEPMTVADPGSVARVKDDDLAREVARLTGAIEQVPSSVSAIKVEGRRAYDRVRAGERVELSARSVTISAFDVLAVRRDGGGDLELDVHVECSSGTYIRALARDLGAALGVGGHLTALRRTRVGPFSIDAAAELEGLDVAQRLLSPADAATTLFDAVQLTADEAKDLMNGKRIASTGDDAAVLAALAPRGTLVGLVERRTGALRVLVNLPADELAVEVER